MKRFLHNASHEVLTTFNQGQFIPILTFDAHPNETLQLKSDLILRTQPLNAPIYAKCKVVITYYAIPIRLLWAEFDQFRTGGADGDANIVAPYVTSPASVGWAIGSLMDYLGAPTGVPDLQASALFARAYNLVWNTFIRDKDLQPARVISTASGSDTTTDLTLANICWEKDNYTSARPYPQKGDAVSIPLTGDAPVGGIGISGSTSSGATSNQTIRSAVSASESAPFGTTNPPLTVNMSSSTTTTNRPEIYADLSDVSAVNIEDLRLASAIQRFKELMSRFVGEGTLGEFYRLFGVAPQDMRMQWPERLGGGDSIIQFSEVLQTAEGTDPVGELRGHGIAAAKGRPVIYKTMEDCIIMGFVSVKPKTVYMQGLSKMWSRTSRYDYFMPALQNLGQQPVLFKEVDASNPTPDGVFGYQDQYYEYRRIESRVSGEFRDTLKFWHMAREFDTPPSLNAEFVEAVPTDRVYAAGAANQLQVRVWNTVKRKSMVFPQGRPQLK